jgi:hypothetical protein
MANSSRRAGLRVAEHRAAGLRAAGLRVAELCAAGLRAAALVGSVTLAHGGCARASSSGPSSEAAAPPAPSMAPDSAAPPARAASSSGPPLPAAPLRSASAPPPSPPPASRWATAEDCSRLESGSGSGDGRSEQRARSLLTCKTKEELRSFVASRQACESSDQCVVVAGSCPFGCYVPVARVSAAEVSAKLQALGARLDEAGQRCVYRCMSPPSAACVGGRCSTGEP